MTGLKHGKSNPGFLWSPVRICTAFPGLHFVAGMVSNKQFSPGWIWCSCIQVFSCNTFRYPHCHSSPYIPVIYPFVDGLSVTTQAPQNIFPVFVASSNPFPINSGIFFRNRFRECISSPVVSNYQLSPYGKKEYVETIFLCPIQTPIQP